MIYVVKGQVWRMNSRTRFFVESNKDENGRVEIRDEKSGAKARVHVDFFSGENLVEEPAQIKSDGDQIS